MGTANAGQTAGVALADAELIQLPIITPPAICGDGVANLPEECDDGNTNDGDGCAFDCTIEPITKTIAVACSDSATPDIWDVGYELTVDPWGPVATGSLFNADLTAVAKIPEFFLDAVQGVFLGGMTQVDVLELNATVAVRSGASGPDVPLSFGSGPVTIPTIDGTGDACAACNALGGNKVNQCADNGFCVDGDAPVVLGSDVGTFMADAFGTVLLGWNEDLLPPVGVLFTNPAGPNGARWTAGVPPGGLLSVAFECYMGTANIGQTAGVALSDTDLISLPILP
jgi:cysteine-rich repeat protein